MTFLVQLPQLGDQYDTTIAYLTSLTQVLNNIFISLAIIFLG